MSPRISIIVVSYNTREMTLDCLRSVVSETRTPYEIIVVDNASGDGSADAIMAEFPHITVLAETENHGFAGANNLAAERAGGDYLLLLNPDTVILDGAIDRLFEFAQRHPRARIWGGRTLFGDRSLNPASCWRRPDLWNVFCRTAGLTGIFRKSEVFNSEAYGGWDRSTERQVDIVSGCFFLISRADWERLGGLDLDFFMYGEEADLCLRAERELDASPRVTPDATIIHYGGASEKVRADKMVRLLSAKAELIKRHLPGWQRRMAGFLFRLWPLTRWSAHRLLGATGLRKRPEDIATWGEIWKRRDEWRNGLGPHRGRTGRAPG